MREDKLKLDEERLLKLAKLDAKLQLESIKVDYDNELDYLKNEFEKKIKENKRLNEAFKSIKQSNENLKLQVKIYGQDFIFVNYDILF
jgi:hypothetical protein